MIDLQTTRRPMNDAVAAIKEELRDHRELIDAFHRVWYASRQTHGMTFYEGVPVLKNPMDLWVYGEIVWDLRPTLVIETGTAFGGSALYIARQLDRVGEGKVVSIDVEPAEKLPQHPRVTYVTASSTDPDLLGQLRDIAAGHPRVMATLDSDHSKKHVLAEMEAYAPMVTPGQFMVVEDTNLNGRPVYVDWKGGPGPGPAVDEWLPNHPEFEDSYLARRYMLTMHSWLRKVEGCETA